MHQIDIELLWTLKDASQCIHYSCTHRFTLWSIPFCSHSCPGARCRKRVTQALFYEWSTLLWWYLWRVFSSIFRLKETTCAVSAGSLESPVH